MHRHNHGETRDSCVAQNSNQPKITTLMASLEVIFKKRGSILTCYFVCQSWQLSPNDLISFIMDTGEV